MFQTFPRAWLASALVMACSCQALVAHAVPFDSSISVTGTVSLDLINSTTGSGGATQSGSLNLTAGGAGASSTFNQLTVSGANPRTQGLTDIGDNLGIHFTVGGAFNNIAAENRFLFGDYTISLHNSSLTNTFVVALGVSVTQALSAAGADAFVIGELRIEDVLNNLIVFANHTRDTLNGDSDSAVSPGSFNVTLAPGQTVQYDGLLSLKGGAFAAGSSYSGDIDAQITVAGVRQVNVRPVPEPGTIALLALGLGFLGLRRRRAMRQV